MTTVRFSEIQAGAKLPERTVEVNLVKVLRYCGAISDFVGTHCSRRVALAVGHPDVIAHGIFTASQAVRLLTDWAGNAAAVVEYRTRFARPVPAPDAEEGTRLVLAGVVREKLEDDRVRVSLTARTEAGAALAGATAVVQLA